MFEGAVRDAVELEVDLGEAALGGAADGVGLARESDLSGAVEEGLAPDGEEDLIERRRGCRHERMIAQRPQT